ncbi:sister chromatid cohesion protein PDS5 [Desulfonema magnum]|uniref:HEAT repeat domain-containing protein n=1 Tax=Desulfonema magnum TaxID=45655 RepID=A0A975GKI9_9BACT|nr:sister chromatid cohesion protein PDS5 [Desulfonema magnum]QTA84570.1 HEAT repeat domain-containing protein [Desulfonema magnum]
MQKLDKYIKPVFIFLSLAYVAAAFFLEEQIASVFKDQKILLWISIGLSAFNISILMIHLFRRNTIPLSIILLNAAQLGVFFLMHIQIHTILGQEAYSYPSHPLLSDWLKFIGVYILNAADLLDATDAYGLSLQKIVHQNTLAGLGLFGMSLVISLFILGAIFRAVSRGSKTQLPSAIAKWAGPGGLAVAIVMMAVFGWNANGGLINWFLWLLDNMLRTLDVGDAFQIFGWQIQNPKMDMTSASAAVFFRFIILFYAIILLNRVYLHITKKLKSVDDLAAICLSSEHSSEDRISAIKSLEELGTFADSAIPHLVKTLTDSNRDIRNAAAEALGEIDSEWSQSEAAQSVVSDLVKTLSDKDKNARNAAAEALEKIDPQWSQSEAAREVIPNLTSALFHQDKDIRIASVTALGEIGPAAEKAVSQLVKMLSDNDKDVRYAVAGTLGKIGSVTDAAIPHLIKVLADSHVRDAATEALEKIGPVSVPELVNALTDQEEDIRKGAADALENIDPQWREGETVSEAVPHLQEIVRDSFSSDRGAAVEALGVIRSPEVVPHLINVLTDGEEQVRNAAKDALENIDPQWAQTESARNAIPEFMKALTEADKKVRESARQALKKVHPKWRQSETARKAIPQFVKSLSNPLNTIRIAGAESLGEIGPPAEKALPYLVRALTDKDKDVRDTAKESLEKIDPKWRESDSTAKSIPGLIKELANNDWRIRNAVAEALGKMESSAAKAIPYLVKMLTDSDKRVRSTVIGTLEKIDGKWRESQGTRKALAYFVKSLGDSQGIVRISAVEALGEIGPAAAQTAPYLIKAMKDTVIDVQSAAKEALKKVDPDGKLRDQDLGGGDRYIPKAAEKVLGEIDPESPEAIPHLVKQLADGDRKIRVTAKEVLEKIDPKWRKNKNAHRAIPHLMNALSDSNWAIRSSAIEALGEFGPLVAKLVVPRFKKAMATDSSVDVQSAAKKALKKIGN